jgi:hypothetical protein
MIKKLLQNKVKGTEARCLDAQGRPLGLLFFIRAEHPRIGATSHPRLLLHESDTGLLDFGHTLRGATGGFGIQVGVA